MSLKMKVERLERLRRQRITTANLEAVERLKADPSLLFTRADMEPDPWQREVLQSPAQQLLLLCCRQSGKSTTTAAVALLTALSEPDSLILLLSPSLRQSGELFRDKVLRLYRPWSQEFPAKRETALELHLSNGSRILSLPGDEATIRGFSSVRALIVDEAARVPSSLYLAIRPMLAVSRGRLIALSTAWAKMGWFYDCWESGDTEWGRVKITADQCPRISAEFLERERLALGERWYAMEYLGAFGDSEASVFSAADVAAMLVGNDHIKPLFGGEG